MTALGLVVAVPAVLAYNWLIRRNKSIMEDLAAFTERPARLSDVGRRGEAAHRRGGEGQRAARTARRRPSRAASLFAPADATGAHDPDDRQVITTIGVRSAVPGRPLGSDCSKGKKPAAWQDK